jgi:hypothetical protein
MDAAAAVLLLASCAPPPPPPLATVLPARPAIEPPRAVTPTRPEGPTLAALQHDYAGAAALLRGYLAQRPCAPSGPMQCVDRDQAAVANEAQRKAHLALDAAGRHAGTLRVAALRVREFGAVADALTNDASATPASAPQPR